MEALVDAVTFLFLLAAVIHLSRVYFLKTGQFGNL